MTSTGCLSCPGDDEITPLRNVAIALFVIACAVIWFFFSWKPLLSSAAQKAMDQTEQQASSFKEKAQKCTDKIKMVHEKAEKFREKLEKLAGQDIVHQLKKLTVDRITQYLKLYISFFQILASFMTFHVTWPSLLLKTMTWLKGTLFLDVVQLPGLSCLWKGVNFQQRLLTYTLGPLCAVTAFLVPVVFAWASGYQTSREKVHNIKWQAVSNAAWKNVMFWVFLVYPIVSLTVLQAFDCSPAGLGRLTADFNELCPSNDSLLRVWSFAFILVYPVGIPLFCFLSMVRMGVHLVARDKIEHKVLSAMVAKYSQLTTSIESQRIARLFNSAGSGDARFNRSMDELWSRVTDGTGNGHWNKAGIEQTEINGLDPQVTRALLDKLSRDSKGMKADEFRQLMARERQVQAMYGVFFEKDGQLRVISGPGAGADKMLAGIDQKSIKRFVKAHDQDDDGFISIDEFRDMVADAVKKSTMFTGVEGDRLTSEQAVALLTYDWKSVMKNSRAPARGGGRVPDVGKVLGGGDGEGDDPQAKPEGVPDNDLKDTDMFNSGVERVKGLAENAGKAAKMLSKAVQKAQHSKAKAGQAESKSEDTPEQIRSRLLKACNKDPNSVAARIWELGRLLLQNKVISVPEMTWTKAAKEADSGAAEERASQADLKKLGFVIHPDLDDNYRISSVERFLASGSFTTPDSWKNARSRKQLEQTAMSRVGFVFAAYKINFWFWEMLEMLRK